MSQALTDTRLYFTAPLRWDQRDWEYFGASLLAVGVAHEYDDKVRAHFQSAGPSTAGNLDQHDSRDWAPAAAMVGLTWAYATLIDNRDGYREGYAMLESAALSATTATLLKLAAGRKRPTETERVDDWRRSGSSFPSIHATVTFAIGTVLAESGNDDYRWVRRILGYGLAAGTAYARVHDGVHWLSDVMAGAALGTATGGFIVHREDDRRQRYILGVAPLPDGAMITASVSLH